MPDPNSDDDAVEKKPLGLFGKYLTVWVLLCMLIGTFIGYQWPVVATTLSKATVEAVSIPVAVLIFIMIYPMLLRVDITALGHVRRSPGGVLLTTAVNWLIQPFLMYGLAVFFFQVAYAAVVDAEVAKQYVAGAVMLGGSPCTAMVFVWTALSAAGDGRYGAFAIVQVALNDIILLFAYVPTMVALLSISSISLPWGTVILSVALFVALPFVAALVTRAILYGRVRHQQQKQGPHAVEDKDESSEQDVKSDLDALVDRVASRIEPLSLVALLVTLILIFIFQGERLVNSWSDIFLIAVPLTLQTMIVFSLTYGTAYFFGMPHFVAAPAAFIGSSNFFELGVAVSITVFGIESGAALVNVVGVLTEVPIMLLEVYIANRTKAAFARRRVALDKADEGDRALLAQISAAAAATEPPRHKKMSMHGGHRRRREPRRRRDRRRGGLRRG